MDAADDDTPDPLALVQAIAARLTILDPDEQRVLRLRFGLDTGDPLTPSEVATELDLAATTVRAIERRALKKLRAG